MIFSRVQTTQRAGVRCQAQAERLSGVAAARRAVLFGATIPFIANVPKAAALILVRRGTHLCGHQPTSH